VAAARVMADLARASEKAFIVHSLFHASTSESLDVLRRACVPVIGSLETACAAVAALVKRGRMLERPMHPPLPPALRRGDEIVSGARSEKRSALIEPESRALAASYGVPIVAATLCTSADEVVAAAVASTSPIAVRLVSSTILHKTDAGGVRLNVTPAVAARVFDEMVGAVKAWASRYGIDPDVRGVLVSPMMPAPAAELIVGARRDPAFGPLLALGIGGVGVEAIGDVAIRLLPANRDDIFAALDELRASALLHGIRGNPAPDLDEVAELALALGNCLMDNPYLSDIEANPVFAYADRAVALDVRALLHPEDVR
jgi:acetyltransferase